MKLSYYSKVSCNINTTPEQLQRYREKNLNKIVTIDVPNDAETARRAFKEYEKLRKIIYDIAKTQINYEAYHEFQIPKHSGGYRTITAPCEDFKAVQHRLLRVMQKDCKYLAHNAAHGFVPHRGCKTALEVHQKHNARWFLKIDIKDFFPSITNGLLFSALSNTYPFGLLPPSYLERMVRIMCYNGSTPQGAPTSPIASNIVMCEFDIEITKYAQENGLTYTRYADDLLISSPTNFDWQKVQQAISNMLSPFFTINEEKTRYGNSNGRNWNLGIMYNKDLQLTVGHRRKKLIKNMIHNYQTKEECHNEEYLYQLQGQLSYGIHIEPDYFRPLLESLQV